jgi:hypothetical protein
MGKDIVKLNEISKTYSDLLAERLADGYVLNMKTMSGTQGEYGRFDLTKDGGKTVHRLYMSRDSESDNSEYNKTGMWYSFDTLRIVEEEFDNQKNSDTLWTGKGNKVLEKKYYLIDRKRSGYKLDPYTSYTQSVEFMKSADRKHYERVDSQRYISARRKIKPTQKMVEIVNRFRGFKNVKLADIESVEVGTYRKGEMFYCFTFSNRKHTLTIDSDSKYLPRN